MIHKKSIIISDFDGVIGNSLSLAVKLTQDIIYLLNRNEKVESFADYYKFFGRQSENKIITDQECTTIRELHRILIRHHCSEITLFSGVTDIYSRLTSKPIIVSSSYCDVVKKTLVGNEHNFEFIYGYETGHKKVILEKLLMKYNFTYVTDTLRDIEICKALGIQVIATCWGYDTKSQLESGKPSHIADNVEELETILRELNFL